ncbi:MAG: Eco47II family restriction endonuclease [Bifidobacteriaceae bacterium]|jgi:hypothetical protein|nr:Eco47II family restriction endonuclease [Bifidobacteriaceae bacterium]
MWNLSFISEENFTKHVYQTIRQYSDKLYPIDLKKFNNNFVDPIKLIFDKYTYDYSWDQIIKNEIYRQRDKSNNNNIGYFHQKIFQYIKDCQVPKKGWDVIYNTGNKIKIGDLDAVNTIYAELKNKHNIMNSSSAQKTFTKMQSQLLADDNCACFLVEVIAKKSQNISWNITVDGKKLNPHGRIRRISIDRFYEIVTGKKDAFYQVCMVLPKIIGKIISNTDVVKIPEDTVIQELESIPNVRKENSFIFSLYLLGFANYIGFSSGTRE